MPGRWFWMSLGISGGMCAVSGKTITLVAIASRFLCEEL